MAAPATTIPRFLLPRITQSARYTRYAAFGSAPARGVHSASSERAPRRHLAQQQSHVSAIQQQRCQQSRIISAAATRRSFSATAPQSRDHHFDTLKFVQRLKDEGFTEEQAVAMMRVLSDVIEESIQNLTRTMVLREDQERATYTQKVDFAKLRSELMTADSTESSLTRASHERLTNEIAKLNSRLRDDIQRTQASVRLDLNLEKGRIREEANVQELKLRETETRIEQETATLRERLEAVKFSTLQWLMGVCTGTAALMLGVWRLLM
ncbi:DUF1640-domain-containing protein [Byssothecium circinans]|uniref:DUF1640-domain-containing protein n=1 Tax=Byssothecium circinans TaxID=147558 RepID=A0A6A5TD46_9PLEO|nr:DUF1640-domain-containing protein [Byssothecium circinans]